MPFGGCVKDSSRVSIANAGCLAKSIWPTQAQPQPNKHDVLAGLVLIGLLRWQRAIV